MSIFDLLNADKNIHAAFRAVFNGPQTKDADGLEFLDDEAVDPFAKCPVPNPPRDSTGD